MDTVASALVLAGSVVVAILVLAMVFYEPLLVAFAWLLQMLFVIGLCASVSALWLEPVYDWGAAELVEASGAPGGLREADRWIQSVREMPANLWQRLRGPFARLLPAEPPEPVPLVPVPLVGPLESHTIPALTTSLAASLRVLAFGAGVSLMLFALLFRSATDLILAMRALRKRVTALEAEAENTRLRR